MSPAGARCLALDTAGGLAGDMFLGLLLDLGADEAHLREALASLELPDWTIEVGQATRRAIGATRADVRTVEEHAHRHLPEIEAKIEASALTPRAQRWATEAFRALARAEAAVHRVPVDKIHFHEVGAADAILDICGVCVCLDQLEIDRIFCGPLPGGSGVVRCAHGEMPVPVPAVIELCQGRFALVAGQGEGEMVTPTGMCLVAALGEPTPPGARFVPEQVGYGAGTRPTSVLRGTLGRWLDAASAPGTEDDDRDPTVTEDEISLLAANLDDVTGERVAFCMEQLMGAGALDVTATPCLMKKGRPGTRVEVMCEVRDEGQLASLFMRLTRSLGVRVARTRRIVARRELVEVTCEFGKIAVKVSHLGARPEYEDCAAAARSVGVHVDDVARAALAAYEAEQGREEGPS